MSAFQKKNPLHFKTQYGLGFDPQDDEIVVDFFCGGGGAGPRSATIRRACSHAPPGHEVQHRSTRSARPTG